MTRLDRFKAEADELRVKIGRFTRQGKFAPPKLVEQLRDHEAAIEEMEEAMRVRPISELLTKEQLAESGIIDKITEIHLTTDFLARNILDFIDTCHKYGVEIDSVSRPALKLVKEVDNFVDPLMRKNEWLLEAMTCNEFLSDALHKKIQSYIDQRKKKRV